MKILFHTHTLNYRGTAVAVYDYAKYNEEILGNESVIAYYSDTPYEKDMGTEPDSLNKIKSRFEVREWSHGASMDKMCEGIDMAYFIRAGHAEPLPTNCKTAVHSVFQFNDPHGDVYAYISEWLSRTMSNNSIPYVPHIVTLPEPNGSYRERFNLEGKMVIGRYGGFYKFDIPFVRKAVKEVLEKSPNHVFLFVNTMPFMKHERVIYLDSLVDVQKKSNYLNTCDAFLHARTDGESFGLALCESLFMNKPTLAWNGGRDRHHIDLLKGTGLLYDEQNVVEKILSVKDFSGDYRSIVKQFGPEPVMSRFKEVFIEG
jgi:hypothetical protein